MQSGKEQRGSLKRGFDTSFLSRDDGSLEKKARRITPMATAFATHSQWESRAPAAASASPSEFNQKQPSETMQLQDRRTTATAVPSGSVVAGQRIAPVAILPGGASAAGLEASTEGRSDGEKGSVATDVSENGLSDPLTAGMLRMRRMEEEEVGVMAKRITPWLPVQGQRGKAQGRRAQRTAKSCETLRPLIR